MQVSSHEPSLMQFYVSKQWINKFNTFSEPGAIDNSDFLCPHGGVQPLKATYVCDLVMMFNQGVWEYLHQAFGGGPACTSLYECVTCRQEQDALLRRQRLEHETFIQLHSSFQSQDQPQVVYAISMRWFRTWDAFVLGRQPEPPGPLDNSSICFNKNGQLVLKPGSDYAPISREMWQFFFDTYGGGPELFVRYRSPQAPPPQQPPTRRESYDVRGSHSSSSRLEDRHKGHVECQNPMGLKSLSTDDIPYCVVFNQQRRGRFARQRTVSASEVRYLL
ncbi:UNVERIFIED_CONTAM: hypothetical protein GTU68_039546 [Idotea baltica]|nr:hypothetical protein [Idotea baltica]